MPLHLEQLESAKRSLWYAEFVIDDNVDSRLSEACNLMSQAVGQLVECILENCGVDHNPDSSSLLDRLLAIPEDTELITPEIMMGISAVVISARGWHTAASQAREFQVSRDAAVQSFRDISKVVGDLISHLLRLSISRNCDEDIANLKELQAGVSEKSIITDVLNTI